MAQLKLRDGSVWGAGDSRNEALSAIACHHTTQRVFFIQGALGLLSRAFYFVFSTRSAPRGGRPQRDASAGVGRSSHASQCLTGPSLSRCGRQHCCPPPRFEVLKNHLQRMLSFPRRIWRHVCCVGNLVHGGSARVALGRPPFELCPVVLPTTETAQSGGLASSRARGPEALPL